MNREAVIIANTHHAVNNALQKIRSLDKNTTIIKVGTALKGEELDDSILKFEKFSEYYEYSYQKRKKKRHGYIVGMTIWSAISYLGLRHHAHFRPYQALIDEASLMPLSLAAILGKTAPSICLFGDSQQMPPIFRPGLENNQCGISVLDYCAQKVEGVPVKVLHTTYRMNENITEFVSRNFYEPHGIKLEAAAQNRERKLVLPTLNIEDERIVEIFSKDAPDIVKINPNSVNNICDDENLEEAQFASKIASYAMNAGTRANDIAIITPYRKQVRAIRSELKSLNVSDMPLVDTVERLQGQDVELIIISLVATNPTYIKEQYTFLYSPNRLNVMISRAKSKVVIIGKWII